MNTTHRLALLACLTIAPALAACTQHQDETEATGAETEAEAEPATAIERVVNKVVRKARHKLATENLTVSHQDQDRADAELTPQGELMIAGRAIQVDARQRALLLDYREKTLSVAEAGIEVGLQGADLARDAMTQALAGIFNGETDQIEQRIEAEAEKIGESARKLCNLLPALLEAQQNLAQALPAFEPYATMTQDDVDDCQVETKAD